jgi:hypothetical protein
VEKEKGGMTMKDRCLIGVVTWNGSDDSMIGQDIDTILKGYTGSTHAIQVWNDEYLINGLIFTKEPIGLEDAEYMFDEFLKELYVQAGADGK